MSTLHRIQPLHHLHVVIKLSKRCNLRCTYCFEYEHLADPRRMDPVQLRRVLLNVRDYVRSLPPRPRVVHLVLHGGEPLLLPPALLREVDRLRQEIFAGEAARTQVELQTNLVQLRDETIAMLRDTRMGIGVSFDVEGGARVDVTGRERRRAVLRNMDRLHEAGVPFGGISVLHRRNLHRESAIFDFWYERGIDFRLLPILTFEDAPSNGHDLGLAQHHVLGAMQRLADAAFARPRRIAVLPIDEYVQTALRHLRGQPGLRYDPGQGEWALVVDTNGDTYTYGDSYAPAGHIGNFFETDAGKIFRSEAYAQTLAARRDRMGACQACPVGRSCTRLHLGESAPSERVPAPSTAPYRYACPVARPMIEHVLALIGQSPVGRGLLRRAARRSLPALPTPTLTTIAAG